MLGIMRPDISGLRLTMAHSLLSWAIIRHFLLTTEYFIISLCFRNEKTRSSTLSGRLSMLGCSLRPDPMAMKLIIRSITIIENIIYWTTGLVCTNHWCTNCHSVTYKMSLPDITFFS